MLCLGILFLNSLLLSQNTYNVPGHFNSISAALAFQLFSGDKIRVVSSTTENAQITIPDSIILEVNSGVTITFNGGLIVHGNLITNGTAVSKVKFIFSSWGSIVCWGKGELTYTDFTGSNWSGIRFLFSGSDGSRLINCTISGTLYTGIALLFQNNTGSAVVNCTMSNLVGTYPAEAINANNSKISVYKNKIENNYVGIGAYNNSVVDDSWLGNNVQLSCINGNNRIKGNDIGISVRQSTFFLNKNNYNNISGNITLNVNLTDNSRLYTITDYFGGNPPPLIYYDATSRFVGDINGNFFFLLCEPSAPFKVGVLEENTSISIAPQLKNVTTPYNGFYPGNGFYPDIEELKRARDLESSEKYNEAIDIYKSIILNNKDYKDQALIGISYIYRTTKDKDLLEYIKIYSKSEANPFAKMIYANTLIANNYVEEALLEYAEISKRNPATIYAKTAFIQQAYTYYFIKNDERKVKEILAELEKISKKDDDIRALKSIVARDIVDKYEESEELVDDNEIKEDEVKIPGYSLNNYPNPFNPTTTVQFSIPKDEFVTLTVYDVTGRVVKELVNGYKTTGTHNVEFNASSYSSGTYYYKIEAGDYKNIQKMMLIK
jgi:tetratricopeptide (TPR) repeat protein